jgi:hypothetical protein
VILVLLVVAVGIPITRRLHDAVPSAIRAGVASGVGTLTWLTFLPFAFVFGAVSDRSGVDDAGWTLIVTAIVTAGLLAWTVRGFVRSPAAVPLEPVFAAERFLPPGHPDWPGHWADPPRAWNQAGVQPDSEAALAEVRAAINDLPAVHHDVIVRRDVERRPPGEVQAALGLGPGEERDVLNQARGHVRRRLDAHLGNQRA